MKYHPVPAMSGLSRRTVLGRAAAAAGLSLGVGRAAAQDATPEPPRKTGGRLRHNRRVRLAPGRRPAARSPRTPPGGRPRPRRRVNRFGPGRSELNGAAIALAEAGYVTFNIDYRLFGLLKGTNPWPAQLDDVQRAVRWVRANAAAYGVDPERIGASAGPPAGSSSGSWAHAIPATTATRRLRLSPAGSIVSSRWPATST